MPPIAHMTAGDFRVGDVLMCKNQSTTTHNLISFGQNLTTGRGSSAYVHAAIVVETEPSVRIIESHGEGVTAAAVYGPATVYRLDYAQSGFKRISLAAAEVARELMGEHQANPAFGQYSRARATFSLFRRQVADASSSAQVVSLAEKRYEGSLFCSMFVVICYQVAIERMKMIQMVLPLEVDAAAMQPSYLVQYMNTSPHWIEVGDYP